MFGEIADGETRLSNLGHVAEECWAAIPAHFIHVEVDAFCVMPNHFHGILVMTDRRGTTCRVPTVERFQKPVAGSLPTIIRSFKSAVTRRIREMQRGSDFVVWQRNYYERVIRGEFELKKVRGYIADNPLRWAADANNPARPRPSNPLAV
jgi:REP element-mobilizing transposase RayT